ncbi:hypothetical protein Halru_0782 [Halovivax ruber XH-70]|uniref:Uncharacterized protein n=1 Tax=Halovivax ruber (strain DSM 18193 / JCM 13892 / XH-70) TaxID=797302 RepID=L0I9B5_HALRX|nr:hypothetical protein Halru_0782 [Halovivax ruber XH-70]
MTGSSNYYRDPPRGPVEIPAAVLGCGILLAPLVVYTNAVLGSPLEQDTVKTILLAVCGVGTVLLVVGVWSLDRLWTYVLVLITTAIGVAALGAGIVLVIDSEIPGSDPAPIAIVWAIAYPITFVLVNRIGIRL